MVECLHHLSLVERQIFLRASLEVAESDWVATFGTKTGPGVKQRRIIRHMKHCPVPDRPRRHCIDIPPVYQHGQAPMHVLGNFSRSPRLKYWRGPRIGVDQCKVSGTQLEYFGGVADALNTPQV